MSGAHRKTRSGGRLALVAVTLALVSAAGCTPEPLPEEGSASATLYQERCGTCHRAYQPRLLKPKMWEAIVARMEIEMLRRGVPITPAERRAILDYLSRNAGTL